MKTKKEKIKIIKVPLNYKPEDIKQSFAPIPVLYLELLENKEKVKKELKNVEYIPKALKSINTKEEVKYSQKSVTKSVPEKTDTPKKEETPPRRSETVNHKKEETKQSVKNKENKTSQKSKSSKNILDFTKYVVDKESDKFKEELKTKNQEDVESEKRLLNKEMSKYNSGGFIDKRSKKTDDGKSAQERDRDHKEREYSKERDRKESDYSKERERDHKERDESKDKKEEKKTYSKEKDRDESKHKEEKKDKTYSKEKQKDESKEKENSKDKKRNKNLEDLLKGKINDEVFPETNQPREQKYSNIPPKLSDIERGDVSYKKNSQNVNVRNLNNISKDEQEELEKKRELLFRFSILRKSYKEISIPEYSEYTDLYTLQKNYDQTVKMVHLDSSVAKYKKYLIAGFMLVEFVLGKFFKFDMNGFTQQQLVSMNEYERLLIELGEKSYLSGSSSWPVEVRLVFLIVMNAALFIITKMIFRVTGTNFINMFSKLTNSTTQPSQNANTQQPQPFQPVQKKKMKGPDINVSDL